MARIDKIGAVLVSLLGFFVLATMTLSKEGKYFQSYPEIKRTRYLFQKGTDLGDPKLNMERDIFGISFSILVLALFINTIAGISSKIFNNKVTNADLLATLKKIAEK